MSGIGCGFYKTDTELGEFRPQHKLDCSREKRVSFSRQFRSLMVCTMLIGAMSAGCHAHAQGDGQSRQRVIELLRLHHYRQSLTQVNQLLTAAPRDCRLLSLRGMALSGLQKPVEAVQSYKEALRNCPDDLLALEGAAGIEYARRQQDTAVLLNRVLEIHPADVTANAMLASIYRSEGKCRRALPHFAASSRLFPERPQYQQAYAYCLAGTGHYRQAAANYQQAMGVHPDAATLFNLALVQWKLHEDKSALATLTPLLKNPNQESVMTLGAQLAEETGDTPLAVKLLRSAIVQQPDDVKNYLQFAQIALNHHSPKVGIDMLNAGLTQLPNAAQLYLARGVLEVQISEFDAAIADFQKAHRLAPQLSLAMVAMGIMDSQQYKQTAALELYHREAKLHPGDGFLEYLYAEALSESSDTKEANSKAIAAANRSVGLQPDYAPARDLLALLYLRVNKPRQAVIEAQAALRIHPMDDVAMYHEIMAYRRLGQKAKVRELVKKLAGIRREKALQRKSEPGYVLRDATAR